VKLYRSMSPRWQRDPLDPARAETRYASDINDTIQRQLDITPPKYIIRCKPEMEYTKDVR
jgi:hypothetical protein